MFIPARRRFAQPQQATRINWRNPLTRGMELAVNFGEADHSTCVNLVSGSRLTASSATAPERGVGVHGKWQGRGNSDGNYWISSETFPSGERTVVALIRDLSLSGNRFIVASFDDGSAANWVGFDGSGQPVTNLASSNAATGLSSYMANDAVYGWDIKLNNYRIYQRGRHASTGVSSLGTPALKNIGGVLSGFSTYPSRMYLVLSWARVLSAGEHLEIALNPWQVFAPMRGPLPMGGVTLEARYGRPISDVSTGLWTPSSGGSLAAMLDETSPSDADYISVTSASTCEVLLTALADPGTSNAHVLRVRMKSNESNTAKVSIRQGAGTEIAAFTQALTPTETTYEFALNGTQIDAITNYTDLRLRIEGL
jgi:hypothetical protein